MKQWQISELERKEMEDVNYKKIIFHFCDEVADRIEKWFEKIELNHTSRFEDCRTNHFFYIENGDLQYLNTDVEEDIMYLLDEGFEVIEIVEDESIKDESTEYEEKSMTLQEYTDKLQELCHNGHAQKKIVLFASLNGETFLSSFPAIRTVMPVVVENSIGIDLGDFRDIKFSEDKVNG